VLDAVVAEGSGRNVEAEAEAVTLRSAAEAVTLRSAVGFDTEKRDGAPLKY
jgi:hypothetical protein